MMALDCHARVVSNNPRHPAYTQTKQMLAFYSTFDHLPTWQHFERYLENPKTYTTTSKASAARSGLAVTPLPKEGSVEALVASGLDLIKRLCHRVDWVLQLLCEAKRQLDLDVLLRVIATVRYLFPKKMQFSSSQKRAFKFFNRIASGQPTWRRSCSRPNKR